MIIIDLKNEHQQKNYSLISLTLQNEIITSLQNGKKIVLFHNRKGYARRAVCGDCKYLFDCSQCQRPMISTADNHLFCPNCQTKNDAPACPQCRGTNRKLLSYGLEKIQQELIELTKAKIKITNSDQALLTTFYSLLTSYDILLATQPPLIDRTDLSNSTIYLAAILNTDTDLNLPDFNASLKVFNRIIKFNQFCKEISSQVNIIQSYSPDNHAVKNAIENNYSEFKKNELQARRQLNYPPYGRIIRLIFQNSNLDECGKQTGELYQKLKSVRSDVIKILPPQQSWQLKVRGNYRYQIVIKKFKAINNEQAAPLDNILRRLPPDWLIDVDPISLL